MAKVSKRKKKINESYNPDQYYAPQEALSLLKECASGVKFSESVEVNINLGVDARKSDQMVRGSSRLPHGLGKQIKVAVFTQGDNVAKAQEAGADEVGLEDLAEKVKKGDFDWDVVIASPDVMPTLGKLGPFLGPQGLMPNPKDNTVTQDVAQAVIAQKSGQAKFKLDKGGILHCRIGTLSFDVNQLEDNLSTLISSVKDMRPASAKGVYIKKVTLSSTMGPGIKIDQSALQV